MAPSRHSLYDAFAIKDQRRHVDRVPCITTASSTETFAWEYASQSETDKSDRLWKDSELQSFRDQIPTPLCTSDDLVWSKRGIVKQILPRLRWCVLSVYRRLFSVVFLANCIGMVVLLVLRYRRTRNIEEVYLDDFVSRFAMSAVAINVLLAVSIRNEHIINVLYSVFVLHTSLGLPLWFRRRLAKVYCFGGIHSGCAVAAFSWYSLFAVLRLLEFLKHRQESKSMIEFGLRMSSWGTFISIIIGAYPYVRYYHHNLFEIVHRFGGWLLISLFWCQFFVGMFDEREYPNTKRPVSQKLTQSVVFWALSCTTILIVYPWLWVRRVDIEFQPLSNHAVRAHFCRTGVGKMGNMTGKVIRISRFPLLEAHSFAAIPNAKHPERFSVIVSRAGDFTQCLIDNPPSHIWVRNIYASGVILVARMFNPVVIVVTGSGIGPCLGLFAGYPNLNCRILWS